MTPDKNQKTLNEAVKASTSIIGLMAAIFTLLAIFLPTGLVQPIGALVIGLILTAILVWTDTLDLGTALSAWLATSIILIIMHLIVSRPATVVGSVVDGSGSPSIGLTLVLTDSSGVDHKAVTDENGEFEIKNIPEGKFTISANSELLISGRVPSGWKRITDPKVEVGAPVHRLRPTVVAVVTPDTPTATLIPPTSTPTPEPTHTPILAPAPIPPDTPTPEATPTPKPTNPPLLTDTPTPTLTPTHTPQPLTYVISNFEDGTQGWQAAVNWSDSETSISVMPGGEVTDANGTLWGNYNFAATRDDYPRATFYLVFPEPENWTSAETLQFEAKSLSGTGGEIKGTVMVLTEAQGCYFEHGKYQKVHREDFTTLEFSLNTSSYKDTCGDTGEYNKSLIGKEKVLELAILFIPSPDEARFAGAVLIDNVQLIEQP